MGIEVNLLFSVLLLASTLERNAGEFSSKTPYGYYRAKDFNLSSEQIFDFNQFDFPSDEVNQCEKLNLHVLFRHGTRNPSEKNFEKARKLVNQTRQPASVLSATAGDGDFDPRTRTLTEPTGSAKQLKEIAEKEFAYLAKYTRALMGNQSCADVELDSRSTSAERASKSGHLLLDNLCSDLNVKLNITTDDKLLRFSDNCQRYKDEVDENKAAKAEVRKFEKTPMFLEVLSSVNKAFTDFYLFDPSLNSKDLQMFYEFCALDVAHNPSQLNASTGWCALILDHLQVLDYYMDMEYYYTDSGAYPINYQSACGVYDFLRESTKKASSKERVTLLFAHLETLLPVVTLLNLIDPAEQLTVENYATLGSSRKFRVERIAQFASNLALRTVRCNGQVRIYFLLNERVWKPRHCAAEKYCTLQEFENYYKEACPKPVSEICARSTATSVVATSTEFGARRTTLFASGLVVIGWLYTSVYYNT